MIRTNLVIIGLTKIRFNDTTAHPIYTGAEIRPCLMFSEVLHITPKGLVISRPFEVQENLYG